MNDSGGDEGVFRYIVNVSFRFLNIYLYFLGYHLAFLNFIEPY